MRSARCTEYILLVEFLEQQGVNGNILHCTQASQLFSASFIGDA